MDETGALVAYMRANGPLPLPLDGWDRASIWGWDETTGSLYAHLWRNTDDPAEMATVNVEADDYTPVIIFPETLALHIAIAVDRDPWEVTSAMDEVYDEDAENYEETSESGTVVTMTEGYGIWWPPNFDREQKRLA